MSEGWTCDRCSTVNAADRFGCSNCGLLRHDAATFGSSVEAGSPGSPLEEPTEPAAVGAREPTEPAAVGATDPTATAGVAAPYLTSSETDAGWVPPDADHDAAAPGAIPFWRRIPIGWLIVALFVGGGAIAGWYFNASRSSTGEITKAGDMTAADLRVGDCFDLKDPAANEVEDVTARPCSVAHEYEMFFVGSMPAGEFPADSVFETYVTDNCYPAFAAYIGRAYTDSELSMYWLAPLAEGWRAGDRTVQCAVYHPRVHTQTQSLKGSNQ
jgi:Septum formation